jgi:hypothetical protein
MSLVLGRPLTLAPLALRPPAQGPLRVRGRGVYGFFSAAGVSAGFGSSRRSTLAF